MIQLLVLRQIVGLSDGAVDLINKQDGFYAGNEDALYVNNDYPRDYFITHELIEKTAGFALSDSEGNIVATFDTLKAAEKARAGAKVTFEVKVDEATVDEGELTPA